MHDSSTEVFYSGELWCVALFVAVVARAHRQEAAGVSERLIGFFVGGGHCPCRCFG